MCGPDAGRAADRRPAGRTVAGVTASDDLLAERVRGVLDVPLHAWLGLRLADPGDPAAGLVLPVREPALNNGGVLHGGIVAALLDVAAYVHLLPHLERGENAVTHDATSSLLRAVQPGADLLLTSTLLRLGRSVAFLRSEATVDGVLVGTGQVTKSVLRPR